MLYQLLHEIESAPGTLTISQLAAQMRVEESALWGMIDFWVRKGRIRSDAVSDGAIAAPVCGGASCNQCPGATQCPFVVKMPVSVSLVKPRAAKKQP